MDKNIRKEIKNPREKANVLSQLTYWWVLKLFVTGYKRELDESDLYSPLQEDRSNSLGDLIVNAWERELQRCKKKNAGGKPRLFRVLWDCFGKSVLRIGIVVVILEFGVRMVQPFLLAEMLRYFSGDRSEWKHDIYYYAAAFCLLPMLDCLVVHWCLMSLLHIGMKIRISCCSLVYRKILRLSNASLENETSTGQMVNFLSNDVNRLDYIVFDIHYLWIGPLQTVVITYIIYYEIGWAAVAGMMTFLIFIPLQLYIGQRVTRLALVSAQRTDERLRLMNQIIAGVEIIKMYVWEIPYSLLVQKARRKEVTVIKKYSIIEELCLTFEMYVPRLCLFITVLTYVLGGNNIDAEKVFMTTAFYTILRHSMSIAFPMSIHQLAESRVSLKRIERFMTHAEIPKPERTINQVATPSVPIHMKNVTAKWDETRESALQNIDLSVPAGSLIVIIGQVGSGKSSIMQAILRELPLEKGVLETCGKISYANQQPWIFASSVRQNILFGQAMNQDRYEHVIRVCQLKPDIETFVHGDETIVGERGINLSGGQRARINLARALYAEADIYLLDDPLSAVDAKVGSRIMEECICNYLSRKTRLLVTHQLQYLKFADLIVVMNNGAVQAKGSFEDLQKMNLNFMEIFKGMEEVKETAESEPKGDKSHAMVEKEKEDANSDDEPVEVQEMRKIGRISGTVFTSYWKASGSICLVSLAFMFFIGNQVAASGSDYMVAFWVNIEMDSWVDTGNGTVEFQWQGLISRDGLIYVYSAFTIGVVCLCICQSLSYFSVCMRSSKNLHAAMFRSIVRTKMYFYNTNPAGRVLNRFSKDIGTIDQKLPFTFSDVMVIALNFIGAIIIVGVVNPWLLIPTFITIMIFYTLRVIYISTSRAIKRMEGTTRSPVFDHVGATLQGLTTVRAFKAEKILTSEFDNHQDLHTSTWFIFICISRAFGLYVEFFCRLYVALITVAFLKFDDLAVAGDIGLAITQIVSISGHIQWGIRQTAELENQLTSVERVLEYSKLEEEPLLDGNAEMKPPKEWPRKGLVEFNDVKLKYSPKGVCVLKGITFKAMPREKIGVVGRTGAGKTSLISALFRLAQVEGVILIDGIPTSKITLHDFRSKISIIPQEPILFGGSLRRNLDPFDEYPDDVLWAALEQVEMKETISEMVAGLNSKVSEEGSNFSVGQRQLLCLVRALVRNNKIMVLDEATANVDPQTDALIQKTVRRKFVDCTVFTIAHRLNTVMDSDKILVMERGHLVEFDHPYVLLQKEGYFYNMVQQTGNAMASTLSEMAKNSYYENTTVPS